MICFIEYLRAIATALVANSHFKGVYPNDIFSFGGGFGLALFYMISGYVLSEIDGKTRFSKWYLKRIAFLYIPLYLVRMIELAVGRTVITGWGDFFKAFLFPGSWFGGSMVILYGLYYWFVTRVYNRYGKRAIAAAIVADTAIYAFLYLTKPGAASFSLQTLRIEKFGIETAYLISQCIWFCCMLLGLELKKHGKKLNMPQKAISLCVTGASTALFLAIRLIQRKTARSPVECLLALAYAGFAYSLFRVFMSSEERFQKYRGTWWEKPVFLISACSLEVYYTQFLWIDPLKGIVFPLNLLTLCAAIAAASYLVHSFSGLILRKLGFVKSRDRKQNENRV